jgi:hypothetical protein
MAASLRGSSLRGDKRFLEMIGKLRNPELKRINRRALRRAGSRVRARAIKGYLSGRPLRYVTGELYHSVRATSSRPDEFVTISSPLPQAMPLHFGWPAHNMKGRPWLFPALDDVFPTIADIWVEEIDRAVGYAK